MNGIVTKSQHSLLPRIQKSIAKQKFKKGKTISRLTHKTKKEVKNQKYLITEAKKLMQLQTPCADCAEQIDDNENQLYEVPFDEESIHEEPIDEVEINKNSIDAPIENDRLEMELDCELDIIDQ